jgi:serine/threonine protein phosphatase PrpC
MDDKKARQLVADLFKANQITIPPERKDLFEAFLSNGDNKAAVDTIFQHQNALMAKWKLDNRIAEIVQQPVRVLNATVGKPYETILDFDKLGWNDLTEYSFSGLEELGLSFNPEQRQITGIPTESGDKKIVFRFKVQGQPADVPPAEKTRTLIINPDPKSLWKNLPSNREDPYWKEDDVTLFAPIGDRHILVSSKRGRSHANVGSFREDDFAFSELANGWNIVVVADGAGSAKVSRKGSALACQGVVAHFKQDDVAQAMIEFDDLLQQYSENSGDDTQKKITRFVYNNLGKAAFSTHKLLQQFAETEGLTLKDLSTTLIFTLFKKYENGYALLSFGVGDCPIAVLNKDLTEVVLMNWIDVGEFGGGTRFITMPEIFQNEKFATRFGFKLLDDFAYLVMMSDGIYDPKFSVEANLPNPKNWQLFFADLQGQNDDRVKVDLAKDNPDIEKQFSQWMDFWSPGNHDDRTLAIVY